MNFRRISAFVAVVCTMVCAAVAQTLPEFSTEDSPKWYYLQFVTGTHTIQDNGSGANLITTDMASADNQKWQAIGTKDSFTLKSKAGRYVGWSGSRYTATTAANAVKLQLVPSGHTSGAWEVKRADGTQHMNQFGGTSKGVALGEWSPNDPNNPLLFIIAEAQQPTFSTEGADTWYYLQWQRTPKPVLGSAGLNKNCEQSTPEPSDAQAWKLVGSADNFQLVNRAGEYASVSGTGDAARIVASSAPYTAGFKLVESANANYPNTWEIKANGITGTRDRANLWEGAQVGKYFGFWSANDVNNPMLFVPEASMVFGEYPVQASTTYTPDNELTLWYTYPGTKSSHSQQWMDAALPIGNGRFGAQVLGGVATEDISFTEKTLWSGSKNDHGGSNYAGYGTFEEFGNLYITAPGFGYGTDTAPRDYYRTLDLSTATATVHFQDAEGTDYDREFICSNPDGVIAMRFSASKAGALTLGFSLTPGMAAVHDVTYTPDGTATFSGKLATVSYAAKLKIVPTGGTMTASADGIEVKDADEVLVILSGTTDYDPVDPSYTSGTATLVSDVAARADAAAAKGWDALYADHVADHQSLFNRVSFNVSNSTSNNRNATPTDQLIIKHTSGTATTDQLLMLEGLYFNYGRYLEMGSSRGIAVPSNLQGIWTGFHRNNWYNGNNVQPWNADIHTNINIQMNYWPAEPTNLSECHLPFLDFIINQATVQPQYRANAKLAGQTKGWTLWTETSIFGGGSSWMNNYTIANAWYCSHLWQHYRYTLDRDYLLRAFPAMWSCCEYWMERLVKASDGTYECPREYSPEQGPGSENATAHSQQLVAELFANTLDALDVLGAEAGVSDADIATLRDRYANLDRGLKAENYTGTWGTINGVGANTPILREWKYSSFTAGQNGHRHMSHLMCLYPFNQVEAGTDLYNAAVNSLKLRGDGATGWSMGWKLNLWARAKDGNHAHTILKNALKNANVTGSGVYLNLYDAHTPFQIDGNFGACSGMAEMVMQSHTGVIELLPAIPTEWKTGSVKGLKAVGNFTVDLNWTDGKLVDAAITSHKGQPLTVKGVDGDIFVYVNGQKVTPEVKDGAFSLNTEEGDVVTISHEDVAVTDVAAAGESVQLSVSNSKVTVWGAPVALATVYDLQGRTLLTARTNSFDLPVASGAVLVSVTTASGTTSTHKLVL